jgi:hypothetical protein
LGCEQHGPSPGKSVEDIGVVSGDVSRGPEPDLTSCSTQALVHEELVDVVEFEEMLAVVELLVLVVVVAVGVRNILCPTFGYR